EILYLENEQIRPGPQGLEDQNDPVPIKVHAAPVGVNQHPHRKGGLCEVERRQLVEMRVMEHGSTSGRRSVTGSCNRSGHGEKGKRKPRSCESYVRTATDYFPERMASTSTSKPFSSAERARPPRPWRPWTAYFRPLRRNTVT